MSRERWSLRVETIDLALAERFTIARETWDSAPNTFVTVTFAGISGVGESSPDPYWNESPESVAKQLQGIEISALENPFHLEGVLDLLPPGAARAALDIALHDLAGKIAGLSLTKMFGVRNRPLPPTSVTVPIAERDAMVERARGLADHPILKLKVGFDGDVDVVEAIRGVFPGRIRVDANEGWPPDAAIDRLKALEPFDIELCEQPIPGGNLEALAEVTRSSPIPVFADEDVGTATDVVKLAGSVHGVNLKLRKAGGLREAFKAIATARAHGMGVMLGCDLESGVAATAAAHLAPLVDFADLDGPLLLASDPFPGVTYDRGVMTVPDLPGLGVQGTPA